MMKVLASSMWKNIDLTRLVLVVQKKVLAKVLAKKKYPLIFGENKKSVSRI
ncbi:hypothetical protein P7E02_23845 [Enterococcus hulanensis]|uniref:hypothetical protein n=1 Tax=Enterococcus hulanensis TaxID=2559929 RepID=UPI00289041AE|nr:hypothetical protein [Enterococcus hulanensis]MDT2662914.1 hypothetical protein [Enterococcus hulanensis]